jgi:uncharacterized Zn finger protein
MPVPDAMYLDCEPCGDLKLHEVVHGKVSGKRLELTVRCQECGAISHQAHEETPTTDLRVILSEGEMSRKTTLEVEVDEVLLVGDDLVVDGIPVQVRGIEVKGEKRVEVAPVKEIITLWVVRFDKVKVKFSINVGHRTKSAEEVATPDEEYTVGEMVTVDGITAVIHRIKTLDRNLQRGTVAARDIVRVYGKALRRSR